MKRQTEQKNLQPVPQEIVQSVLTTSLVHVWQQQMRTPPGYEKDKGHQIIILVYGKDFTDASGSALVILEAGTWNNIWEKKKDLEKEDQILFITNAK